MTTAPRYFSAAEVERALTWPLVVDAVEQAMRAVSSSSSADGAEQQAATPTYVHQPQRTMTRCSGNDQAAAALLFTMPCAMSGPLVNAIACKVVTSFPANEQRTAPLPPILANILLFNSATGQLDAIMEATQITGWRTAAASIVATRQLYLGRLAAQPGRDGGIDLAIIGCGTQGRSHALGMCAVLEVRAVSLFNRNAAKAHALAAELRALGVRSTVAATAEKAVADADVICVGTYASHALITAAMLSPRRPLHINTVGAGQVHFGEVGQDIYDSATVYVDSLASAKTELAGLKAHIAGEVGGLLNGVLPTPPPGGITIFQSMGMAAEDLTVAQALYDRLK